MKYRMSHVLYQLISNYEFHFKDQITNCKKGIRSIIGNPLPTDYKQKAIEMANKNFKSILSKMIEHY